MTFTAIDFETANSRRDSACSVGVVVVEKGQIVDAFHQLIRPDPLDFDPFNISIHGITPDAVKDAPCFIEFWPTLLAKVAGPLVAHNASFDLSVVRHSLDRAAATYPNVSYLCTRILAKAAWPDHPTYALSHIASFLGLKFTHHNALEDARACSHVAIQACRQLGITSVHDLDCLQGLQAGRLYTGGYLACCGPSGQPRGCHERHRSTASEIVPSPDAVVDPDHPFFHKSFAFTGAMSGMLRTAAMQSVVDRAGTCDNTVKKTTDYLVLGQNGYAGYEAGFKSVKTTKAEQLVQAGSPIEILSERDFIQML